MDAENHGPNNPAGRVARIVEAAEEMQRPNKVTALEAWADVFGVDEQNDTAKNRSVVKALLAVHEELDQVAACWALHGVAAPEQTYGMRSLRRVFGIDMLGSPWKEARAKIDPAAKDTLGKAAQMMEEQAVAFSQVEIRDLSQKCQQLRHDVWEAELPAEVREVLLRHLAEFSGALDECQIKGLRAFEEAAARSARDDKAGAEVLRGWRDHPVVRAVANLWVGVSKRCHQALPIVHFVACLASGEAQSPLPAGGAEEPRGLLEAPEPEFHDGEGEEREEPGEPPGDDETDEDPREPDD